MKIALVTPRYPPNIHGGGEISCKLLVDNLRKYTKHTIDVVSFDTIYPKVKSKAMLNYKAYRYLTKKIDDYDVFHTYNMTLLPAIGYLTKKYDINSVGTFNGRIYSLSLSYFNHRHLSPKYHVNKFLLSHYINSIKEKTALSPFEVEMWTKDGIEDIQLVTNMIDESFRPQKRKNIDDKIRILFVGNKDSSHTRGLEIFLSIYDSLYPDMELIVVGKGWEKFLSNFKTRDKVNYLGYVPNEKLPGIYSRCNIFYHAKFFEPVPIERVTIEAMQSGMCVISIGSNRYSPIIQNNKSGILIDVDDFDEDNILGVFSHLLDNKEKIRELGENAKIRVKEVCDPRVITLQYDKIYRRCEK